MHSELPRPTEAAKRELDLVTGSGNGVAGSENGRHAAAVSIAAPQSGRAELELRGRLVELEARLEEVTRCLVSAETRASEVVALRSDQSGAIAAAEAARADAERLLEVVITSTSWRFTRPLRFSMDLVRRAFGR